MTDDDRAALNVIITRALKDRIDQLADRTGVPGVRIVESLLRDDLGMPAIYPNLAAHVREIAKG